ncbi:hypothetical protein WJX84_007361 [Apatococcus fuscideae]
MSHQQVTVGEHVQNFLDQCKVASQGSTRKVLWGSELGGGGRQGKGQTFVAIVRLGADAQGRQAVGCCFQFVQNGRMVVVFRNYGCQLRMDHMQLGTSTKKDKADLAGYFGEGAKVELNRLVAQGAYVEYRTGNVRWDFEYLKADGCENPDLHIVSHREGPTADDHTTMRISFPAHWNAKGQLIHAALDFQSYLFFQDSYPALVWPIPAKAKPGDIAGLEVLPDPKHHGRIFAHGMPVCLEGRLKGFGLNYLGHGGSFGTLKLGRDRNSIKVSLLIKAIPSVAAYLKRSNPAQHAQLIDLIYACLEQYPRSAMQDLYWDDESRNHANARDWDQLIPDLLQKFKAANGVQNDEKVPSDSTQGEMELELAYLGIQTVRVSKGLMDLFHQANLVPSVQQLWERHSKSLLDQPDATQLSAEQQQHWRTELAHLFRPWVKPEKLLFKSLLPGNTSPIRALPGNVFLLDANLLGINNVHELMQRSGAELCR